MENLAENVKSSAKIRVIHGMKESTPIIEVSKVMFSGIFIRSLIAAFNEFLSRLPL